jgi:ubiquinol-cytochrome c reductase cytochrome b subunit
VVEREAVTEPPRRAAPEPAVGAIAFVEGRLGAATPLRKLLRYVFPDHWTFMLGEVALYAFVALVASGTFLALFFDPDTSRQVVYDGSYAPLRGSEVTPAFRSAMDLSFDVPGGLLMRQIHHWAALVFIAAIVVHLLRVFFTAAFRRPRELNWMIGVTLLGFAILEGFLGYSLPDDLISGMGLAIAYSVAMSLPLIGAPFAFLVWDGEFPGGHAFEPRLFTAHVFIIPAVLASLIAAHLAVIMRQRHSQFRGPKRREDNVVGTPLWPAYALRSLGLMFAVFAVLVALGGLVQINPIWHWGPYEVAHATNGAQPDWYLGWLIGALRIMPALEIHLFGATIVPNPFFGGVLFPSVVFAVLYAWPWIDPIVCGDRARHDLLDRPRDNPRRTAIGAAFFTWVLVVFAAGSADRILVTAGFSYEGQVWFFRAATVVAPVLAYLIARATTRELRRTGAHPLRGWTGEVYPAAPTASASSSPSPSPAPGGSPTR